MTYRMKMATAAGAVLAMGLAGCSGGAVEGGDQVTVRLASGVPGTHNAWVSYVEPLMESVTEATAGRVQFETFTGGELVEVTKEVDAIESGVTDMALVFFQYEQDRMPMAEVSLLPTDELSTRQVSDAWGAMVTSDEALNDEGETFYDLMYTRNELHALPMLASESYTISGVGAAPESVEDFGGLSLRAPTRVHQQFSNHVGVNSVSMPAADMYDAISRGAFDGSYISISDWKSYGFQELWDYTLVGSGFGSFTGGLAMGQDYWDDLPADVQEAFNAALEEHYDSAIDLYDSIREEMFEVNEGAGGAFIDISEESPELKEQMDASVRSTWEDFISAMDDQGLPGEAIAQQWRAALEQAGGSVPESVSDL